MSLLLQINQTIKEYVRKIASMMPKSVSLPSPAANSESQYALYTHALQRVYQYLELRTNVCQNFRELGNIIIFCLQIEKRLVSVSFIGPLQRSVISTTTRRSVSLVLYPFLISLLDY